MTSKKYGFSGTVRFLRAVGGLIVTGPTGTHVNDVAVVLLGG